MDQLFKYAQIEQDIGLDLDTLFKALKNGVYVKIEDYPVSYSEKGEPLKAGIYFVPGKYWSYSSYFEDSGDCLSTEYLNPALILPLKTYGKKWALTKEELSQPEDITADLFAVSPEMQITPFMLLKALQDGIWSRGGFYSSELADEPVFIPRPSVSYLPYEEYDSHHSELPLIDDEKVLCIYTMHVDWIVRSTRVKDYGRTWALTKEELDYDWSAKPKKSK